MLRSPLAGPLTVPVCARVLVGSRAFNHALFACARLPRRLRVEGLVLSDLAFSVSFFLCVGWRVAGGTR